jgi:hypothetical protein
MNGSRLCKTIKIPVLFLYSQCKEARNGKTGFIGFSGSLYWNDPTCCKWTRAKTPDSDRTKERQILTYFLRIRGI